LADCLVDVRQQFVSHRLADLSLAFSNGDELTGKFELDFALVTAVTTLTANFGICVLFIM